MLVNRISNYTNINFKKTEPTRDIDSQNAILMLRDPNASIKFQQNQEFASMADSVDTNPIKALGYKLYRTFNLIKDNSQQNQETASQTQLNLIA